MEHKDQQAKEKLYSPEKEQQGISEGRTAMPPQFSLTAAPIQRQAVVQKKDVEFNNYTTLAEQIHSAIDGWGTDEEGVYSALASLNQNPTAIAELKKVYKAKYKTDLVADLEGDFSGDELAHVKSLLADGQTARTGRPAATYDMDKIAEQVYNAIDGWGTDEEAVYSAIAQFKNNPVLIKQLKDTYKTKYGRDLDMDILDDFSGSELKYVQQLLADGSTTEKVNVKDEKEAEEAKKIIQRIKDNYGIEVNSQAGVDAIKKDYAGVPKEITDQLNTTAWEYRELVALEKALGYYKGILGDERNNSTRNGTGQEVTTVSKVDQAIDRPGATGTLDTSTLGEYFSSSTNFSVFTAGTEGVGSASIGGPFADNAELLETNITHEIAHGLLQYKYGDFVTAMDYWSTINTKSGIVGAEAPMTPYGQTNAREDLAETAKFFFVKPADLKASCPKRHQFMEDLVKSWTPAKKP